jgi:hypothetical protein
VGRKELSVSTTDGQQATVSFNVPDTLHLQYLLDMRAVLNIAVAKKKIFAITGNKPRYSILQPATGLTETYPYELY